MPKRPSEDWTGSENRGSMTRLAVTCCGPLLALMAFTTPVADLSSTATALGAGSAAQSWILSAMPIGTGATVLSSGAIGDDYGRRATFTAGALLLAGASLLGALAPTGLLLILARILQGIGSAAILSCGLGLIGKMYPSVHGCTRATAVWASALGGGVAIGPLLSAGLSGLAGWRAPYLAIAAGSVTLALVGRTVLPETRAQAPRRVDLAGTLLLGLGVATFLAGLIELRSGSTAFAVGLFATGLLLAAGFVVAEGRIAAPMLDLALFRRSDFVAATVAALAGGAGILSLVSFLPTLLERAMHMAPFDAATMLLAWSATSVASAFGVRWLPSSVSARMLLTAGLVGSAAGQLGLYGLAPGTGVDRLLPPLLIAGVAYGILNAALGREAVGSVPADRAAMGGGANNTARYLGSATGLTVVTVIVTYGGAGSMLGLWNIAVLLTSAFSLLGMAAVVMARCSKGRDERETGVSSVRASPGATGSMEPAPPSMQVLQIWMPFAECCAGPSGDRGEGQVKGVRARPTASHLGVGGRWALPAHPGRGLEDDR